LGGIAAYGALSAIISDGIHHFFQLQTLNVQGFDEFLHAYQVAPIQNFVVVHITEVSLLHALPIWTRYGEVQPQFISDRTSDLSMFL